MEPEKNTQAGQSPTRSRRKWIWVLLFLSVILAILAIVQYIPTPLSRNEAAVFEQCQEFFGTALPFRCTSSSGSGHLDFWTADVAGYYARENAAGEMMKHIDLELAQADFAPLREAYSWVPPEKPIPKQDYYYLAMTLDENGVPYQQDYDNDGKDYTNLNKFGFCAFPANYGQDGIMTFIMSYHEGFWRKDTGGKPVTRWPDLSTAATEWERYDGKGKWSKIKIEPPSQTSYPDGVWVIEVCVEEHHWSKKGSYKDQLTFTDTKISSQMFASRGFAPADYTNVKHHTGTKWKSVQKNEKGEIATWRGRASGSSYLYGTLEVESADGTASEFFFESIKTGPPIPKEATEEGEKKGGD